MDLLAQRISQSVNQLGLQIDQLYKLRQKDRQMYLNKIQIIKSSLLGLKSNLKNSNKQHVQTQYKNARLEILDLKRKLEALLDEEKSKFDNQQNRSIIQNRLNSYNRNSKQNGSISRNSITLFDNSSEALSKSKFKSSRVGVMRNINKKQYEDLMENIVQKNQTNNQLSHQVSILKKQNEELKQSNIKLEATNKINNQKQKVLQSELNQIKLRIPSTDKILRQKQKQIIQARDNELQARQKYHQFILEIAKLNKQLQVAHQKITNYQNLAEMNFSKYSLLEKNLSKYQSQIVLLNQSIQTKQLELSKKGKQLDEYVCKYDESNRKNDKMQAQLKNQYEDIELLQHELSKYQKSFYEFKVDKQSVQTNFKLQKEQLIFNIGQSTKQVQHLKQVLAQKQQQLIQKEQSMAYLSSKLQQQRQFNQMEKQQHHRLQLYFIQRQKEFQEQKQVLVCQVQLKKMEINKLSEQVRKSLELTKILQNQIYNAQKCQNRIKQDKHLFSVDLKSIQNQNIQLVEKYQQIKRMYHELANNYELKEQELKNVKLKHFSVQNQLKQTKIRLHKAKIQAIHDIRSTLF